MDKIKWYDYIAAFIVADSMATFAVIGFTTTDIVSAFLCGVTVSLLWEIWKFYCLYRTKMEN